MERTGNPDRKPGTGITKWSPDKIEEGYNMALLGYSDSDMAKVWGVAHQTVDLWKRMYPDFQKSLRDGKAPANARVVAALYKKATGFFEMEEVVKIYRGKAVKMKVRKFFPPDTEAIKYFLSSREREKWSHRLDVTNTNINITKINLNELTEEDLNTVQKMQIKYLIPPAENAN